MGGSKSRRLEKILISFLFVWLGMESGGTKKVTLCKFTHIFLLKKWYSIKKKNKKCNHPNLLKIKITSKKKAKLQTTPLCHIFIKLLSPNFLLILERKPFGIPREKTRGPHHHFPLSLSQPNILQKVLFSFSLLLLLLSLSLSKVHSTKHTLKGWSNVGFKTPS